MEVRIAPNRLRPGVGRAPARENRRAWLPQQTRFCPVVEDVNKLGFLVYPPLHDHESVQLRFRDDGTFVITLFVGDEQGGRGAVFESQVSRSAGAAGIDQAEITIIDDRRGFDEGAARELLAALFARVNVPPGTVGLRGSYDFVTPEGWDTVFTAVFNELPRPIVPVMTTRVETDSPAEQSAFWYALAPGSVLSMVGGGPIGQVFFVPREEVRIVDASNAEEERFADVQRRYWAERATKEKTTNYGATFTYQYRDHQKAHRTDEGDAMFGLLQDAGDVLAG